MAEATGFGRQQGAMDQAVQAFDVSAENVVHTMKEMEAKLRDTLVMYKGKQAEAFDGVLVALQKQMQKAAGDLKTMSDLVRKADHNYTEEDDRVQRDLMSLNSMIDETNSKVLGRLAGN